MADLVFGLAKSAVVGTLTVVKAAIEEDKQLQKTVKCDLMLISDEFEMMNSFINVAKASDTDDMVRTLVRQVHEMALNVEDCIEFAIQLDKNWYWWRRWLPSCLPAAAPAEALDDVVAKIQLLKSRIESLGHRNKRYGHIRDSAGSKQIVQIQQLDEGNTATSDILTLLRLAAEKQRMPSGLAEFIIEKSSTLPHHVIPVLGTGNDLGMTSFIKEALENPNICQHFRYRVWVKVPHPFNPQEFIQSLLMQFHTNDGLQQGSTMDVLNKKMEVLKTEGSELIQQLMEFCEQRYLMVLEDVSSMVEWSTIRDFLPDRNKGCCIVLHTQQFEIASSCTGNLYRVSEQKEFSSGDSIFVFIKEDGKADYYLSKQKDAHDWLQDIEFIGREMDLGIIHDQISSIDTEVFAVLGISGVGKSCLIKHLYCTKVNEQSFKKFGWVDVSHPFNLWEFSWSLLLDLHSGSLQYGSRLRFKDPVQECRKFLHDHRCLVVVDGLDSIEEWDMAKSIFTSSRSLIIVITNDESVATSCAKPNGKVWNVKALEKEHAVTLFKNRVVKKSGSCSPNNDWIGVAEHSLLPKCGGLPKVITALADSLAGRVNDKEHLRFLDYRFMHLLEAHSDFFSLQNIFACLQSYLRTCPDFLKSCIFYLSIFSVAKDPFRRKRLLRRWMVDGYSRDNKEIVVEEAVEEFFLKLVKLGLIEPPTNSMATPEITMPICQVNKFFKEYIDSRAAKQNQVIALHMDRVQNSQCTGRHLVVVNSGDQPAVFQSINLSKLRSLTVHGMWKSFYISDKMKALQVLDLEDANGVTNRELKKIVKLLCRLKFLSLRRCREISHLPYSIGHHLRQLETLDIRYTSIMTLPKSIIKLRKLQYIRAGFPLTAPSEPRSRVFCGVKVPKGISCMVSLPASVEASRGGRVFGGITVPKGIGDMVALRTFGLIDAREGHILEELRNHALLNKLRVSSISQENYGTFCSVIAGHSHLKSLSVWFDDDNQDDYLYRASKPPVNLRSLKLYGLQGMLPKWIEGLPNLVKLDLRMAMFHEDAIRTLADNLKSLRILSLHVMDFQDGNLTFENGSFGQLICLVILCNSSLQTVKFGSGAPKLKVLKFRFSNVSTLQISGLNHLPCLMEVSISGSFGSSLNQQMQSELNKVEKKIKPVLKVDVAWDL